MTIDTLRLTAEEATALLARRRGLRRRALRRLPRRDRRARRRAALLTSASCERETATGMPIALKDVIGTKGVETTAGSKILAGYVPVYDSTVAARCKARGPAAARQDEHGRVRDGLVDRELGVRAVAQPVGSRRASPAARAAAPRPRSRPGSRRGRSAPTPAARSSSPRRSAATSACARPTAPSAATGSSRSPRRSTRSGRSRRPCATARSSTRSSPAATRPTRRPSTSPPVELPDGRGPEGPARRRAGRDARRRRDRAGRARRGRPRRRALRGAGRDRGGVLAAALGRVRPALLLPDRPGRGLVEPGPLRRRPLRPPRRLGDGT